MLRDMLYRLQVRGSVDDRVARSIGAHQVTSAGSQSTVIVDLGDPSALIALVETLDDLQHELVAIDVQERASPAGTAIRRRERAGDGPDLRMVSAGTDGRRTHRQPNVRAAVRPILLLGVVSSIPLALGPGVVGVAATGAVAITVAMLAWER